MNPPLKIDQYPLLRPEELFVALNGGEQFTKLGLSKVHEVVPIKDAATTS